MVIFIIYISAFSSFISSAEGKRRSRTQAKRKQHALKGQNLRISLTQVAQSDYSSGSIRLLKWLNQITQVAQSDYPSGSIRLLKWLNQTTQVAQSASADVCVTQFSHILNPVQPHQLVNESTSFVYLI